MKSRFAVVVFGAVLGVAQTKVKSLKVAPTLRERTHDALSEESEVRK